MWPYINDPFQLDGNNVCGQSGSGNMCSDSPIHQGQSTEQDSSIVETFLETTNRW